jgi:hypothetical protein
MLIGGISAQLFVNEQFIGSHAKALAPLYLGRT